MAKTLQLGFLQHRNIRLVRQTEVTECGLACLSMVANYHKVDLPLGDLRRRFQTSMRGVTLRSIISVADQIGFTTRAVKLSLESLSSLSLPAILHWNLNHFVVLAEVKRGRALIHDPIGRSTWFTSNELSLHFTGVALELSPADGFERGVRVERLRINQLWRRVIGLRRALGQAFILSIVMHLFVLALPYYMQLAIDQAVPALDGELVTVLALGFGLFTLANVAATFLRSFVLLGASTSLSFGIANNLARKLFRLPIAWFERRHVGDVLSRFQSVGPVREALTQGAVAAVIDGSLAALTLILMFLYSAKLASLALLAFMMYSTVRLVLFSIEREASASAISATAKEQSTMIESLRGITTLRLFNREASRQAQWQSALTDSINAGVNSARIRIWQSSANNLILGMEIILSVWLAVGNVISGSFSIGMVFAFMAYKAQFLEKSSSLIDQIVTFRMLGVHLERLSDIAFADEDVSFGESATMSTELKGQIVLRDVFYRYAPTDPPVLSGINLTIQPGEHVAITGPSGGGKSTLVKILLGLVEPNAGRVIVDGLPLVQFGYKSYRDQVGAVLQDDSLFAGSLAENIALFDELPDLCRIQEAAAAAAIDEDIALMPMRYETLVGDMGSSLSGGQKQRVLLARAIYRRPKLLIMDEGTAHLDSATESAVNSAITNMGITRIVIAHRSETIAAADRVLYLVGGNLIEV